VWGHVAVSESRHHGVSTKGCILFNLMVDWNQVWIDDVQGGANAMSVIEQINGLKPQCPVLMHNIKFSYLT
jgi:hypothetical protein